MTKSTITREESIQAVFDLKVGYTLGLADIEILKRVARMALGAMDSEPVAADLIQLNMYLLSAENALEKETKYTRELEYRISEMQHNYRHAQPAPERDQVRIAHAEWSQATFGNVGPVGPLKHLSKEALEAAAEPGDLSEWADMQFLMWDAQRRAGITDEQITQAMIEKLAVNKQRSWPEPKDGEPRLHIKEQPAPVVQEIDRKAIADKVYGKCSRIPGATFYNAAEFAIDEMEAFLTAMLHAVSLTNEGDIALHNYRTAMEGIGHIRRTLEETFGGLHGTHIEPDVLMDCKTICDAIYAAYSGNSPVIPDGYRLQPISEYEAMCATVNSDEWPQRWIPVSERMPEDRTQVILWDAEIGEVTSGHYSHKTQTFYHCGDAIENEITHWMPPPCAPQEVK